MIIIFPCRGADSTAEQWKPGTEDQDCLPGVLPGHHLHQPVDLQSVNHDQPGPCCIMLCCKMFCGLQ